MTLTPFERALVAHLVADWILQNEWMARNKASLKHPAAWVHAAIHALCLGLAIGWSGGLVLGGVHLIIDTKVPIDCLIRWFKKCDETPQADEIRLWTDQALHILSLALWVGLVPA